MQINKLFKQPHQARAIFRRQRCQQAFLHADGRGVDALRGEPDRPSEHSHAAFLTDRVLEWLDNQAPGWFAHVSYLRPHSPYAAAGAFATPSATPMGSATAGDDDVGGPVGPPEPS